MGEHAMRNSMDAAERASEVIGETLERELAGGTNTLAVFVGYLINLMSYIDSLSGMVVLPDTVVELRKLAEKCLKESVEAMSAYDAEWNRRN